MPARAADQEDGNQLPIQGFVSVTVQKRRFEYEYLIEFAGFQFLGKFIRHIADIRVGREFRAADTFACVHDVN